MQVNARRASRNILAGASLFIAYIRIFCIINIIAILAQKPKAGLRRILAEQEKVMAHVVVLGAGLGGAIMAYEMKAQLRPEDTLTVITKDPKYHFVPSNPWVAVGWRTRDDVQVDLAPVFAKKGIDFKPVAAKKLHADSNTIELDDGYVVTYDYLVIATGPELAFDEIEGLGPNGFTQSICHIDHAEKAGEAFEAFCKNPGPIIVGAVQGASCFGPAYEFLFILETELRRRKIRDRVPMTFVTAEPYIGHLGLDGVGDTKGLLESEMREHHIKWMTSTRVKSVEAGKMTVEEIADDGSVKATKELPFAFSMMLPAFRGIAAVRGIEGLSNPRGFTIVDKHQRNPEISRTSLRWASAWRSRRWGRRRFPAACQRPAS